MLDRAAASAQVEVRLPFVDLRLFRFLATLPWHQKEKEGISKVLLRRAMRDVLPAEVRDRPRKAEFTPVTRGLLERYAFGAIQEAVRHPHPLLKEMFVASRVRGYFENHFLMKHGPHSHKMVEAFNFLIGLVSLDQWLKRKPVFEKRGKGTRHEAQSKRFPAAKERRFGQTQGV